MRKGFRKCVEVIVSFVSLYETKNHEAENTKNSSG